MVHSQHTHLSRRERQIVDVLYQLKEATAHEVLSHMPDAPSYSAVRTFLRKLEEKGHVAHREDGVRYVYRPLLSENAASRGALSGVLRTFFSGSASQLVARLLDSRKLSDQELQEIETLVQDARAGRKDGKGAEQG